MVSRTEGLLAIEDINPKADVHLLVIPERHIETFRDIGELSADEGSACSTSSPTPPRSRASMSTG